MSRYALIAIGYNRVPGMMRLLDSLSNAVYDEPVDLIISLDTCGSSSVEEAVSDFEWTHGKKIIRTFPERQGLRRHVLSCGDYLNEYEAVAVFEDDIVAASGFFSYMKQCAEYYADCENIAGISLYSHRINVNNNLPFDPQQGTDDVYFMQFAQSWGQVWLKKQWFAFAQWYAAHCDEPVESPDIPSFVSHWSQNSWLKYHIKYCISENKYFVYPYKSLSTCFSDIGQHCKAETDYFQVALMSGVQNNYRLCRADDANAIRYDAFYEREGLEMALGLPSGSLCTDIYGTKGNRESRRYWLTRANAGFKVIASYALHMRPHESNVTGGILGEDIFLYDTQQDAVAGKSSRAEQNSRTISYYYNIAVSTKKVIDHLLMKVRKKVIK